MYYPVWDGTYERSLAANQKGVIHEVVAAGFLLLSGTLPYITVNKMCSVCS